ncbi:MAG: hypothetical protein LGB05_08000 [Sulfurovum sp.]|nr:hypothetical protein [Sulfurovum sp.]MCB4773546.1 hypothetical protein [Sulfurovum sp.]
MVKQIILIRHAKVLMDNSIKLKASEMMAWVESYNHAPIEKTLPTQEAIRQIKSTNVILASTLSRTRDSLDVIGVTPKEQNALFDEADIPQAKGNFLKLRPKSWLVILRLMMLVGIGKKSQSFKASKHRSKEEAAYLHTLSTQHENVVLMGHGGMNWLMGKALESLGWELREKHGANANWSYKVYSF